MLRNPAVPILDGSFAALDPQFLRSPVETLLERDAGLGLIANP